MPTFVKDSAQWTIEIDPHVPTVRIAWANKRIEKQFTSELDAAAFAKSEIGKQLARGWKELAPVAPRPDLPDDDDDAAAPPEPTASFVAARNPALEAQCFEAAPKDAEPWRVYADWLVEQDDPRGEIALLDLAGRTVEANRRWALHGGAPIRRAHGFGSIVAISGIGSNLADTATARLASPLACTAREVKVGLALRGNWGHVLLAIGSSPIAAQITKLEFAADDQLVRNKLEDDAFDEDELDTATELWSDSSPVHFDREIADWWPFVALEELAIDGPYDGSLGKVELPNLRRLTVYSDQLCEFDDFVAATWPKLEYLEISAEAEDDQWDALFAVLPKSLRTLVVPLGGDLDVTTLRKRLPELAIETDGSRSAARYSDVME